MNFNEKEYLNSFKGENGINIEGSITYIKNTLPEKFYKFYSLETENDDRTFKTLSEAKVWFGKANTMNDPFEFKNLCISEEKLLADIKKMPILKNLEGTPKYKEIYEMEVKRRLKQLELYNKFLDEVFKQKLEIFCVSKNVLTNISMWAHYTNNHQGFVLEFELLEKNNKSLFNLKPVLYEDNLCKLSYSFIEKLMEIGLESLTVEDMKESKCKMCGMLQFIFILCSCKDKSWTSEEEYRFFKTSDADKGELISFADANLKLTAIYSGVNISIENKEKLKYIANCLGVAFKEMKTSNNEYKFEEL